MLNIYKTYLFIKIKGTEIKKNSKNQFDQEQVRRIKANKCVRLFSIWTQSAYIINICTNQLYKQNRRCCNTNKGSCTSIWLIIYKSMFRGNWFCSMLQCFSEGGKGSVLSNNVSSCRIQDITAKLGFARA